MEFCDVAIVGGGYAGTVLALHLARILDTGQIAMIEPRAELGSGLAYSATDDVHCINVTARQMGVSSEPRDCFADWLETRYPELVGGGRDKSDPARTFVQRRWFGHFVRDRLAETLAASRVTLVHHRTWATDARVIEGGLELTLENGLKLRGRRTVVATSHGIPALPASIPAGLAETEAFVADPWHPDALNGIASNDDVLIVGTGLTMADMTGSLLARFHHGRIVAVSRHGLLSRSASAASLPTTLDFALWPSAPLSVHLRRLRREIGMIEQLGGSWRDIFTALRQQSGELWSKLAPEEKRRFLRHLKCFYDVHRYRMAPALAHRIEIARQAGQVEILAGNLRGIRRDQPGFIVDIRRRGASHHEHRRFDAIINCTGPRQDLSPDPTHFLGALIARGLAYPDPLGLGLIVDGDCRVHGIARDLFALGPLTRGRFGDMIGAPEITIQAQHLARIMAAAAAPRCNDTFKSEPSRAVSS